MSTHTHTHTHTHIKTFPSSFPPHESLLTLMSFIPALSTALVRRDQRTYQFVSIGGQDQSSSSTDTQPPASFIKTIIIPYFDVGHDEAEIIGSVSLQVWPSYYVLCELQVWQHSLNPPLSTCLDLLHLEGCQCRGSPDAHDRQWRYRFRNTYTDYGWSHA